MTSVTITVGAPTKCRSCGAAVVWATTEAGKLAPYQVDEAGRWVLEHGKARYVGDARQLELGVGSPVYFTSHFAVCEQADQWRKR